MLNAVLWLSGIFLCQAISPAFNSACWNPNRKVSNLWLKPFYTNPFNISRSTNMQPYPCYKTWFGVPKNYLRPPISLYPRHRCNQFFNNWPSLKKRPSNQYPTRFLESANLQNQFMNEIDKDIALTMPLSLNTISNPMKNEAGRLANELNLTDYNGKLKDPCFSVPHNETMIISPSILIGRKNKSCANDNWILSDKPISIFLKKNPKTDIYRIDQENCELSNILIRTSPRCPLKQIKNISLNNNDKLLFDEEYEIVLPSEEVITTDFPEINENYLTTELYYDESSTDYDSFENFVCNSHEKLHDMNEKSMLFITTMPIIKHTHPVKKKVTVNYKTENLYNYEINVDELSPDEEEPNELHTLKKLKHKNDLKKKIKRAIKLNKKHNKFNFSPKKEFRNINFIKKEISNISRPRNKLIKKRALVKNTKNNPVFTNDLGDYENYYEYVIENKESDYPDVSLLESLPISDYVNDSNLLEADYGEQDDTCVNELTLPTTSIVINMLNQLDGDNKLSKRKGNRELRNNKGLYSCPKRKGNIKSKSIKHNSNLYLSRPEHLHRFGKTNHTSILSCSNRDLIIKNLTDELSQKMVLLSNLTLENLLSSKNTQFNFNNQSTVKHIIKEQKYLEITTNPFLWSNIRKSHAPISKNDREVHVFDEMFVSPNKISCELRTQHRCACSPLGMIKFFSNEIQKSLDAKMLLKKLITYSCEEYFPIELHYCIASDMKPRLISKKRKELIEDQDTGPKEITPIYFEELLMRGIPREGVDIYVFPSTTVEIPCFSSDEMKLSPNIADSAMYRWSHSNLKAITEGRILEDANHKGSLIIQDVTLADSDNYTCSVHYIDPDSQVTVMRVFIHAVKVVVLPRLALHTNLHYVSSQKCDQELLEMFELYLPQQIQNLICSLGNDEGRSICSVEIHNPVCYTKNKQDEPKRSLDPRLLWRTDFQKSRWIREILNEDIQEMEMSLNYELDLGKVSEYVPEALNWSHCSPHCQQKISLKTIEILRDSFLDALLLPVKSCQQSFEPVLSSVNIKLLTACDGGLELKEGFCVPCRKHYYSEHGRTICIPCPVGTYQDNIGAKSCIPCPHPFRSNCFYMWNFRNMIWVLLAILALISFLWICWLCCLRFRRKKIVIRCCAGKKVKLKTKKPEPLPPDFE